MNGAQLLRDGQHADTTTVLDHAAPDCASRQTYKTVLQGKSRGVFQGKIHVHQVAQRTDGYQMNQALLLSPEAEIDSKPQLEIYADDVKCSHGATVGALDAEQLFYCGPAGFPRARPAACWSRPSCRRRSRASPTRPPGPRWRKPVAGWWSKEAA
jgi:Fe-S cluster assembly protein SufD